MRHGWSWCVGLVGLAGCNTGAAELPSDLADDGPHFADHRVPQDAVRDRLRRPNALMGVIEVPEGANPKLLRRIMPLSKFGKPEDCAAAVAFLANALPFTSLAWAPRHSPSGLAGS